MLFDIFFWLNVAVSLYQYFVLELSGDYLGGIFGTEKGGNAYTNVFFLIMLVKDILFYLEKRQKPIPCMLKCGAMLLVAALAELKFFFVEFILVLSLAVIFTKFTWRKILIILGGSAAVVAAASLLMTVFPEFEGFLSLERILEVTTSDKGYTSSGDLNRLNAISRINELWLKTPWQRLFGLGLGKSRQKYLYLPFQYNDYIFAIICEELGLIGALLIIVLFSAMIIRGYWIALRARDRFSTVLAAGLVTLIAVQTALNLGVVTNLLPSTGIALPFFSYGGTALAVNLGEMGVVLSISRQRNQTKKQEDLL